MMNTLPDNEMWLYRFLLDEFPPDEMESLEIRLLTDDELQTQVTAAEFDLIDDYLRGALTAAEHTRFEQHFLNSPERRSKLMTAQAFLGTPAMAETPNEMPNNVTSIKEFAERKAAQPKRTWRFPLAQAASVLLLLSLSAVIYRVFFSASPSEQGLALLQRAYKNERPLEARVSGFDYAPYVQLRGANDQSANSLLREQAASELRRAVIDKPSAATQHALGTYYLHEQKFDEAIKQFEAALKAEPQNAQYHNDLGAALMELAKQQKQANERNDKLDPQAPSSLKTFAQANEHFAQALQRESQFAAALFNQALCLEQLGLPNQASEAWQKYLQIDATSDWADEARRKLVELEEQKKKLSYDRDLFWQNFVTAYQAHDDTHLWQAFNLSREQTGNAITERILDEYLILLTTGQNNGAASKLAVLAHVAEMEAQEEHGHDLYTNDLVSFYRRVTPHQSKQLIAARNAFKVGRKKSLAPNLTEALSFYQQARQQFTQAGSDCEVALTDYLIGTIQMWLPEYEQRRASFENFVLQAKEKRYSWLTAQSLWLLSNLHMTSKEYSEAIVCLEQGIKISASLNDFNGNTRLLVNLIDTYRVIGEDESCLFWLQQSLNLMAEQPAIPRNLWRIHGAASLTFSNLNFFFSAIDCQQESLRLIEGEGQPLLRSRSLTSIGELYSQLNNDDKAIEQLEAALAIGQSMIGDSISKNIAANANLRLGHLHRKTNHLMASLRHYDQAIQLFDDIKWSQYSIEAHRGKALIHLAQAEVQAAQTDLQSAQNLFESNLDRLTEENLRNSYFDRGQDVYDLAIQLSFDHLHNPELAFNYSELGRARSLLRSISKKADRNNINPEEKTSAVKPMSLAGIKKMTPPSVQIIQYAMLSDTLYVWVVSNSTFFSTSSPIRLAEVETKIATYLKLMLAPRGTKTLEAEQISKDLYKLFVLPVERILTENQELCIIPDEALSYLPFAGLIDPVSGKYLLEKYTISYSPSSTVFLTCTERAQQRGYTAQERCLSVGNPLFDRNHFPDLPDLPDAAREASRVAQYYTNHSLLLGSQATESQLRHEFSRAQVIHLASHGLVNEKIPGYSGIILAQEPLVAGSGTDGILQADEVAHMRLPRADLAILSACDTGKGKNYHGEGMVGLARAFLSAGVPLVIASLQPVETGATEKLMTSFHRYRMTHHLPSAQALRQAQLEMLRGAEISYRAPTAWASFVVVGGHALY